MDVVVIGGGQAGLACGYWLRRAGIGHVILDDQDEPGGAWQHTWPAMRLFSPSTYSSLPGWPMPEHPDAFPPVEHVLDYLRRYEQRYELDVRRPVRVRDVVADPGGLLVRTSCGAYCARYVLSATGTWTAPFVPRVDGSERYGGRQLHSAHYRGPGDLTGQRVAVVGGGNSGVQIAADLLGHAAEVTLVSDRRLRFLPDDVDGRVLFDEATAALDASPLERQEGALARSIVALPSVRAARAKGALHVKPMFDRLTPTGAVVGREHLDLDAIVWATGYRPALRHLRSLRLRTREGLPEVRGARSSKESRVGFVGYGDWSGPSSATIIGVGRAAKAVVAQIGEELGVPA